jgi:two-component system chemotaxis sensor kinase CheA
MDHGIEMPDKREAAEKPREGTIHLSAEHRGERVRIILQDDGAGINREKVFNKAVANGIVPPDATLNDEEIDMLIFHPGFSTADEVTNVSGRGVGMDVVKKKVQALGGRVALINSPAKGAQFIITLPLTLAVLDGMTVGVGAERFILPLGSIVEAVKLDSGNVDHLPGEVTVLRYRGDWLPMICLRQTLNLDIPPGDEDLVVVVETETDGRIAIVVDELLGQRQVVLKSLEANFRRVEGVSGATILGDGRVALILDIPTLQAMSGGGLGSSSQMLQEFTL